MISYADFITLLFAFFVVMFASSQTDKGKVQQVSDSIRSALEKGAFSATVHEVLGGTINDKGKGNAMMKGPGGVIKQTPVPPTVVEFVGSLAYLNQELKEDISKGKIQINLQPRGLVISLRQATFFPSGTDTIAPDTYPTIEKIAVMIRALPNPIRLEGHTDAVPIKTPRFHSNWELSAARGIAMLELFCNRFDVPRSRLAIAGYAETMPIDSNDSDEGRAHNRRVDIVILSHLSILNEPVAKLAAPPEKR
jgi:chemotaxis protein MotB